MSELSLKQLLQSNLRFFQKVDLQNANNLKKILEICPKDADNDDLIAWWKQQEAKSIVLMQNYLFWMWTNNKIEQQYFESVYEKMNTKISESWSMPIEITTGIDSPVFEGGFMSNEFSIFQYKFSPSGKDLLVKSEEYPALNHFDNLDLVLDFLSFTIGEYNYGYLGFRPNIARKWKNYETKTISIASGPEIRQMIDFDFRQFEGILSWIDSQKREEQNDLSLIELLRIRHRAILDSSLESKIITLWSAVEAQWGEEDDEDFLLEKKEKEQIIEKLAFLDKKLNKVVDLLGKLKNKTRNEKIIEAIRKLDCAKSWNVDKTVKRIHKLRSKFAHGGTIDNNEVKEVGQYISFMLQILNELISIKLSGMVIFKSPE